eukprot:CAMPEP_0117435636 /NCGR_PEP_ID=MMETSP0759-20121206/584_1 /TAXON_ID=63605 /ORGANISM="Percolomonas cosmopolitus, Strain WS" /LENGTH=606 /DNA_ID=CAMNT_0005227191 /DNA_START=170 /DNA_END=1990 /DNA_ORIENTATION=-
MARKPKRSQPGIIKRTSPLLQMSQQQSTTINSHATTNHRINSLSIHQSTTKSPGGHSSDHSSSPVSPSTTAQTSFESSASNSASRAFDSDNFQTSSQRFQGIGKDDMLRQEKHQQKEHQSALSQTTNLGFEEDDQRQRQGVAELSRKESPSSVSSTSYASSVMSNLLPFFGNSPVSSHHYHDNNSEGYSLQQGDASSDMGGGTDAFGVLLQNLTCDQEQLHRQKITTTSRLQEANSPGASSPTTTLSPVPSPLSSHHLSNSQISKFKKILFSAQQQYQQDSPVSNSQIDNSRIDLNNLRKISWNGITEEYRAYIWKLLIGYLPVNVHRHSHAIKLKREEYSEMVQKYFYEEKMSRTSLEKDILKQIQKDVPRTHPSKLFQSERIMQSLERLLYIWSIRHPASGYVQGIDNLATPFFLVFLSDELHKPCHETLQISAITSIVSDEVLRTVECDTFWCLDSFLNFVQDFYTHGHPGIHKVVDRMENIIRKSENQLYQHLERLQHDGLGLGFSQFGFRWVNCLLMREFDLLVIVRLFDSFIAEGERLAPFITFLSASLLKRFASQICRMDYLEAVSFFQDPPTKQWQEVDKLEELLSEAFILQNLYENT